MSPRRKQIEEEPKKQEEIVEEVPWGMEMPETRARVSEQKETDANEYASKDQKGWEVQGGGDRRGGYGDDRRGGYGDDRRGGYGDDRRGGYGDRRGDDRRGGYGDRQGGDRRGGYGDRQGGYGEDRRGGFGDRQGGYGDDRRGGYGDRQGRYGDDRRGGYGGDRQGGYGDDRRGGYGDRQGGYGDDRRGGYGDRQGSNGDRQGGYGDDRRGGYGDRQGSNGDRQGGYGDDRRGGYGDRPDNQFKRRQYDRPPREEMPPSEILGVFNLSQYADENSVENFVRETIGDLSYNKYSLVKDRDTGRSRGFAFFTFNNVDDAKLAKERLSGKIFYERELRLDFSQPKPRQF